MVKPDKLRLVNSIHSVYLQHYLTNLTGRNGSAFREDAIDRLTHRTKTLVYSWSDRIFTAKNYTTGYSEHAGFSIKQGF